MLVLLEFRHRLSTLDDFEFAHCATGAALQSFWLEICDRRGTLELFVHFLAGAVRCRFRGRPAL